MPPTSAASWWEVQHQKHVPFMAGKREVRLLQSAEVFTTLWVFFAWAKTGNAWKCILYLRKYYGTDSTCMISLLQRRILPISTSNATSKKKSQIQNLNHLSPGGISNVSQFSAPLEDLFVKPRSWKIPPPRCHFACRNFCSSKVFCASTASGTPGTKGGCFSEVVIWMYWLLKICEQTLGKVENSHLLSLGSVITWLMWVRMGLCSGKYAWRKPMHLISILSHRWLDAHNRW